MLHKSVGRQRTWLRLPMIADALDIFVTVLLPALSIVALAAMVHRFRPLHLYTLSTLNIYLFVPAYLFARISRSTLSWADIGRMGLVILIPMAVMATATFLVLRAWGASRLTTSLVVVGGVFFNAGNFGVPVAELTFGAVGGHVQALVLMFLNFGTFFVAHAILAMGQGHGFAKSLLLFFKLPFPYVIAAALAVREYAISVPAWLSVSLESIALGMVPIALVTLGAQLASQARWPRWSLVGPVMVLKLILLPLITAFFVWALDMWPWPGVLLILAAAAPTAINTLVLALELEGDAETAADVVFWTTLGSSITVAIVLTVLRALVGSDWTMMIQG
jgi:predicted permease